MSETSNKMDENTVRSLLQKHVHRTYTYQDAAFKELFIILEFQDKWKKKLDTIYALKVTRMPKGNKPIILQVKFFNNNRWFTVSWRNATNTKRKQIDPLQSAFRNAIRPQIEAWKRVHSFSPKCTLCESTIKLEVDHKDPTFINMTKQFLQESFMIPTPTQFKYHTYGKAFLEKDNLFELHWQLYHANNATLQWLCKKCNLSKSKT